MFIQPIDYFLAAWFAVAGVAALYVGIDQYRNNPEPVVMKWGFVLITLYTGPIGLLLYVLADKEPRQGNTPTLSVRCGSRGSAQPSTASQGTRPQSSSPRR